MQSINFDLDDMLAIDMGENNPLYCFDNQTNFELWANLQPNSDDLLYHNNKALDIRKFVLDNSIENKYNSSGDVPSEYTAFMTKYKKTRGIGIINLFDESGLNGIFWTFPGIPMLTISYINNRAESVNLGIRFFQLCDKTWFLGSRYWYIGIGAGIGTLNGFNNRTSSVLN